MGLFMPHWLQAMHPSRDLCNRADLGVKRHATWGLSVHSPATVRISCTGSDLLGRSSSERAQASDDCQRSFVYRDGENMRQHECECRIEDCKQKRVD